MHLVRMRISIAAAAVLLVFATDSVLSQSATPKAGTQRQNGNGDGQKKDGQKKIDEFVEAASQLDGPAASPECVWLGRRVVGLIWRDDLDTAFRHLDLYDRFGCPAGHVQATFRCLVQQGIIDLKTPETLAGRVHACWINPTQQAKQPSPPESSPSAAAPTETTNR